MMCTQTRKRKKQKYSFKRPYGIPVRYHDFKKLASPLNLDFVEFHLSYQDLNEKPWKEEGKGNSEWILMDYVNVVAHIFYKETRSIYNIEDLWGDAPVKQYLT